MIDSLRINGHYVDFSRVMPLSFHSGMTTITGKNGRGKCLAAGTLLRNPVTGQTRAIESLTQEGIKGFQVMGYTSAMKLEPTPVVAAFPSGRKALFRLTLENGYSVVCSETHPFLTPEGSQELKDLKVGGVVAAPRHLQNLRGARSGVYLPVLMGALIADGGLTGLGLNNGTATYTKEDPLNQEVVAGCLRNLGMTLQQIPHRCPGHYRVVPITRFNSGQRLRELLVGTGIRLQDYTPNASSVLKGHRGAGPEILRTISASTGDPRFSQLAQEVEDRLGRFRRWVDSWGGLKVGSRGKRIPDLILTADRSSQIEFLQGLFAGDGHVSKVTKGTPRLEYSSASLGLIEDLRYLLLQLGVATRVAYKPVWLKGKKFDSWRLTPAFSSAAWELCRILSGLPHSKKSERILQALQQGHPGLVGGHGVSISDTPPLSLYLSDLQLRSAGVGAVGGRSLEYLGKHPQSREKLQAICQELGATAGRLFDVAHSDVYWTRIASVTAEGEGETYDIEVGNETHLYALDGVITHNSSVIEMIRFALFGTAALRRPASDYKKLEVELEFTVRGTDYRVSRSPREVSLRKAEGNALVATGTTPVNSSVVRLLGYGLKVFDIANCCNQFRVTEFSDGLKPGDRKKMIDETIGLSAIDEVIEELNKEYLGLSKAVRILENAVAEKPEPPCRPTDETLEDLDARIKEVCALASQVTSLKALLSRPEPQPPQPPAPHGLLGGIELYQQAEEHAIQESRKVSALENRIKSLRAVLSKQPKAPVAPQELPPELQGLTMESLKNSIEASSMVNALRAQLGRIELPSMTMEEIERAKDELLLYSRFITRNRLLEEGSETCPACHHEFPRAHSALEHFQDVPEKMSPPPYTSDMLARQVSLQQNIAVKETLEGDINGLQAKLIPNDRNLLDLLQKHQQQVKVYESQLAAYSEALEDYRKGQEELEELEKQLAGLPPSSLLIQQQAEAREALRTLHRYEEKLNAYLREEKAYGEEILQREKHRKTLEALNTTDWLSLEDSLRHTRDLLIAYNRDYKAYTDRLSRWEEESRKIAECTERMEDLSSGKEALRQFKLRVKSHLLPSLNTVSSLLITEMTGGELSRIEMDDSFDIKVDGLAIEALSGAGKAVANLALRLGLGQVLTNKVFSVFLGDEMDASMDEDRSRYLMDCLKRLNRSHISQVIVVTHKNLPADHTVRL